MLGLKSSYSGWVETWSLNGEQIEQSTCGIYGDRPIRDDF
jgi:hypothetical protein